jgi:hypothetical protein
LILINALFSACWEKKEKEKKTWLGFFFPQGQTHLAGCASWDFCGC